MSDEARNAARIYFQAWETQDFELLRSVLADDATVTGPMGTASDAAACVAGIQGMTKGLQAKPEVQHVFVDGDEVVTWFLLHTDKADPVPVANWSRLEDGKIAEIRVTFDPRPLLG